MENTKTKSIVDHGAKNVGYEDKKERGKWVPLSESSMVSNITTLAPIDEKFRFGKSENNSNPSNPFITESPSL